MFRHTGVHRTHQHNVRLAALLCLTAGFVNVAGYLAFTVLTTNVTGHVAIFAEKLALGDVATAQIVALWMLLFWLGAFVSSLIVNSVEGHRAYVIPIVTEVAILIVVAIEGQRLHPTASIAALFAGSLLFAMGMQNALVSMISGSVVRTTHLTGMFTDLGIELALLIKSPNENNSELYKKIYLRWVIILFFFLGGISGGFLFKYLRYYTFLIPALILLFALGYDLFFYRAARLLLHHKHHSV